MLRLLRRASYCMLRFVVWELSTILRLREVRCHLLVADGCSWWQQYIKRPRLQQSLCPSSFSWKIFFCALPRYTRLASANPEILISWHTGSLDACCDLLQYDPRLVATDVLPRRRHSIPEMSLAAAGCIKLSSRRTRLTQTSTSSHILPSEPAHAALTTPEICRLNRRWRISVW
jgi:hypothetical protein